MSTIQETEVRWREDAAIPHEDEHSMNIGGALIGFGGAVLFGVLLLVDIAFVIPLVVFVAIATAYGYMTFDGMVAHIKLLRDELQSSYRREEVLEVEIKFLRERDAVDHYEAPH